MFLKILDIEIENRPLYYIELVDLLNNKNKNLMITKQGEVVCTAAANAGGKTI